jgi:biotin carboxyl carrier protein
MTFEITIKPLDGAARDHVVEISTANGHVTCRVDGNDIPIDVQLYAGGVLSLLMDGRSYEIRQDNGSISVNGMVCTYELRDPRSLRARRRSADSRGGPKKITAPMPGKVVRIIAAEGEQVEIGQGILVIEAMKMQNEMRSPKNGVIKRIAVAPGAAVNAGDTLVIVE